MLLANYAALEQRHVTVGPTVALPIAVPVSSTITVQIGTLTIPSEEFWLVSIAAGALTFDDPTDLTVAANSVFLRIIPGIGVVQATAIAGEDDLHLPLQVSAVSVANNVAISMLLSGVELSPRDRLDMFLRVTNSNAVTVRNITNAGMSLRVRPFRLVSEQGAAILDRSRVDPGLDQRLRSRRG